MECGAYGHLKAQREGEEGEELEGVINFVLI